MSHSTAATRRVNAPGTLPVITEEQLWAGLERKVRNPEAFLPMITSSKVVVDDGDRVVREVIIGALSEPVREEIIAYRPAIIYFRMASGMRVTNIVSYGPEGELLLTLAFANGIPGIPDDQPKPSIAELDGMIGSTVQHIVDVIRGMVKAGSL